MTLRTLATVLLSFFAGSMASDLFHVQAQSPCAPAADHPEAVPAIPDGNLSAAVSPSPQSSPPAAERERSRFTLGTPYVRFGADMVVARVSDRALKAAMGREHQTKPAYAILSFAGDIDPRISYRVELNPADDAIVPRPYVPSPDDRRTYFFPNQPEGRGVVSDPSGLYKVDTYKHPGLDPVIQQGLLRVGYFDLHDSGRKYGIRVGRFYVPKGLGLDEATWFTAKDLTHIQAINLVADNGLSLSYDRGPYRLDLSAVTGNGNPYHDYGYFDFTEPAEDKNTDVAVIATGRVRTGRVELGASYQVNDLNSRIEDAISLQLSKHHDDAVLVFGSARPTESVRLFGELARYTWGLTESSAELLAGPPLHTPVIKTGFYLGADLVGPATRWGRWGLTVTTERLSRDDALVAWTASRGLFNARLGEHERSTIVKVHSQFGRYLTSFFFLNFLDNPFPELSAIRPISGYGAQHESSSFKFGYGMRLRMRGASD